MAWSCVGCGESCKHINTKCPHPAFRSCGEEVITESSTVSGAFLDLSDVMMKAHKPEMGREFGDGFSMESLPDNF